MHSSEYHNSPYYTPGKKNFFNSIFKIIVNKFEYNTFKIEYQEKK